MRKRTKEMRSIPRSRFSIGSAQGGINRSQFLFDGADLYVIDMAVAWNTVGDPAIADSTLHRIKSWKYTQKGWFAYEYCMPEYPEVTEIANGGQDLLTAGEHEILQDSVYILCRFKKLSVLLMLIKIEVGGVFIILTAKFFQNPGFAYLPDAF